MALLTPTQLRQHIDTDLTDDALQRVLDDVDAEMVRRFGADSSAITEIHRPGVGDQRIFTDRRIASVTSIVETTETDIGETTITLAVDDYTLEAGRTLRRDQNGTNSRAYWAELVTLVYVPVADTARRIGVTIDVCRLALAYQALSSSSVGDVSMSHVAYEMERERLLRRLEPSMMGRFV